MAHFSAPYQVRFGLEENVLLATAWSFMEYVNEALL